MTSVQETAALEVGWTNREWDTSVPVLFSAWTESDDDHAVLVVRATRDGVHGRAECRLENDGPLDAMTFASWDPARWEALRAEALADLEARLASLRRLRRPRKARRTS